jgi:hypothetical protein
MKVKVYRCPKCGTLHLFPPEVTPTTPARCACGTSSLDFEALGETESVMVAEADAG